MRSIARRAVYRQMLAGLLLFAASRCSAGGGAGHESRQKRIIVENSIIHVVDHALLAAEQAGVVESLAAEEGDLLRAGDAVVQLRDAAARARLEVARARSENDVNLRFTRTATEVAKASYDAGLELEQQHAISAFQLRQRQLEYERGMLSIEQAEQEQELARLEAAQAEAELAQYRIDAPFDGVVVRVFKREGESVLPGDAVLELVGTERVHVEGYVGLAEAAQLHRGNRVEIEPIRPQGAPLGADVRLEGELLLVDSIVQPVSGLVRVVVKAPNPDQVLRDGTKARLVIDVIQREVAASSAAD